jgi:hypothetical protein
VLATPVIAIANTQLKLPGNDGQSPDRPRVHLTSHEGVSGMNRPWKMVVVLGLSCSLSLLAERGSAATVAKPSPANDNATQASKVLREYKGIKLGLKREQVRAALGPPESSGEDSDDFKLTGEDTMTVRYENGEVKAIQLAFLDAKNAPAWPEVVGDAEITELANGAKTARKMLPEEKCWVAIYQNKEGTVTRITISR